jgi:hypothetical protein
MLDVGQEVWATVKLNNLQGKVPKQGGNIHGNEEKGYQESC